MTNTGTWLPRVGEIWMPNGDKFGGYDEIYDKVIIKFRKVRKVTFFLLDGSERTWPTTCFMDVYVKS